MSGGSGSSEAWNKLRKNVLIVPDRRQLGDHAPVEFGRVVAGRSCSAAPTSANSTAARPG